MNTHIRDMVKRIVDESPEFATDEIEDMFALQISALIHHVSKDIVQKYSEFSDDEIEEMIALVMKCLLAGVDAKKVIDETFSWLGFTIKSTDQ